MPILLLYHHTVVWRENSPVTVVANNSIDLKMIQKEKKIVIKHQPQCANVFKRSNSMYLNMINTYLFSMLSKILILEIKTECSNECKYLVHLMDFAICATQKLPSFIK